MRIAKSLPLNDWRKLEQKPGLTIDRVAYLVTEVFDISIEQMKKSKGWSGVRALKQDSKLNDAFAAKVTVSWLSKYFCNVRVYQMTKYFRCHAGTFYGYVDLIDDHLKRFNLSTLGMSRHREQVMKSLSLCLELCPGRIEPVYEEKSLADQLRQDAQRLLDAAKQRSVEIQKLLQEREQGNNYWSEFAKQRWYETDWDYFYRVRKVPSEYLGGRAQVWCRHFDEESMLAMIWRRREIDINDLANNVIAEYSQKETISANDVMFSIKSAKKPRWSRRRVCLDSEHRGDLNLALRNKEN